MNDIAKLMTQYHSSFTKYWPRHVWNLKISQISFEQRKKHTLKFTNCVHIYTKIWICHIRFKLKYIWHIFCLLNQGKISRTHCIFKFRLHLFMVVANTSFRKVTVNTLYSMIGTDIFQDCVLSLTLSFVRRNKWIKLEFYKYNVYGDNNVQKNTIASYLTTAYNEC